MRLPARAASLSRTFASVVLTGAVAAAVPPQPDEPVARNVLFVSFDTTRADRLSAYGYPQSTSPALAALAARGVLFEHAYTQVPSTLPAHSTMFTGRYPASHGVRCNGKYALPDSETTIAEVLRGAGLTTGAVVGGFPLDARFGIAQGFQHYDDDFAHAPTASAHAPAARDAQFWIGHRYPTFERPAAEVTDRAIRWLSRTDGRWFLFAHYFDPHTPYDPPIEIADAFAGPYDAEIAAMDAAFGRLLDYVDTLPGPTLIVATADHGEGLGDHGEARHNRYLYDTTLRVPLVIALTGETSIAAGRVRENVSHIDLFPTIVELAGIPVPTGLPGRSLAPALFNRPIRARAVFAETLVWSLERPDGIAVRALIEGNEKVVRTDRHEACLRLQFFDRGVDPGESADLAIVDPRRAAAMAARLAALEARIERAGGNAEPFEFDEETEARLKSLGYL